MKKKKHFVSHHGVLTGSELKVYNFYSTVLTINDTYTEMRIASAISTCSVPVEFRIIPWGDINRSLISFA